jgi:exonuclease SbcC
MLALDDYASGLKKTADTLDELRKRINFNKTQIEDIDHKYTGLRAHIDSLPTFENDVQASEQLVTISKQLYSDLQLYVNTEISYSDINQASVREWRAMTESSLLSSQDRLADLQKIEMGFEQFVSNKSTFIEKSNELLRMELEIKDKTIKNNRMEKACDKLKKEVEIVRSSLLEIETRIGSMNQVDNLRASIDKNKINISKLEVELQNLVANCQKNEDTVQKLFSKHDNIRENIFHLDTEIQSRNGRIELLSRIHDNFPNYRRTLMEADKLQQSITSLNALLQVNDKFITENNAAVLLQENDLTTIERELSMLTAEQTRLTSLLDEIETYIQNGICPICGIDHKTKSILIERIHAQKQERPSHVDELFERCNLLSDVIKQSRELTKDKITERTNQNKELEDADIKHAELCVYLTGFEKDLGEAKVILDEHSEEHVEHRLTDEQTTLQPLISSLSNLNQELENTNKTISELQYSITIETSAKNRLQGSINKIEQQNTELMNSIESMGFCSEITTEQIASETGMLLTQKMALVNNIDTLVSQIKAGEPTEQIADLEEKAKQLTVEKQTLEYQNIQYEKGFTQYFGSNNITIEEIKKQKQVAISDVNNLDSLNKRCIAFERIIDATYRSVLFIELDSQSQSLLKEKQTISESYKKLLAIEQYFNKVKGALESETSIGIANHVEAFAPLTTLVQKRLRAVYGFGDVRLKAEKNAIRVFVEWGSRQVKPADYFSDSQKQILMLSIFLSSRLSQTWSGFAPILLDDPVTHFDDLNAFGFIELLRGIASNDPGKRQFFISTCEERLFDLMKSKFHNIEGKAKFYRLKDIDSYGPIIE